MNFADVATFVKSRNRSALFFLDTCRLISDIKAASDDCRGFAKLLSSRGPAAKDVYEIHDVFFAQIILNQVLQAESKMTLPFYVVSEVS